MLSLNQPKYLVCELIGNFLFHPELPSNSDMGSFLRTNYHKHDFSVGKV